MAAAAGVSPGAALAAHEWRAAEAQRQQAGPLPAPALLGVPLDHRPGVGEARGDDARARTARRVGGEAAARKLRVQAAFAKEWDIDRSFAAQRASRSRSSSLADKCVLQAFSWTSHQEQGGKALYQRLREQLDDVAACGFTDVILPPCCQSHDPQGFSPVNFYSVDSAYGSAEQLRSLVQDLRGRGISAVLEVVLARGFGQDESTWAQHSNTVDSGIGGPLGGPPRSASAVDEEVVTSAGPAATAVMDHSNPYVEADCKGWLLWLKEEFGFASWRFDLASNMDPAVIHAYCQDTHPAMAVSDVWKSLRYNGAELEYNQDQHREQLISWVKAAKSSTLVMDYTTKGILQQAVERCEYWRLIDPAARPPGLIGIMPAAAATFVDNHFTGSENKWWPFPAWGVMVGYAYILTHPGVPVILHEHLFEWELKEQIQELMQARKRNNVNALSEVNILLCSPDIYVARIGKNVKDDATFAGLVLKIGPSMDMRGTCPQGAIHKAGPEADTGGSFDPV